MNVVQKYICIFFIYAFLGWCMETFGGYFKTKKLVNRGFLIGPYCPVYGIGVALITALLSKYVDDLPVMFCMSILICGTLEYFTSYIMEKVFKARWWDYHNRKFNINGRICLETLIPFGFVGTILVKFVNPFFLGIISKVPFNILNVILGILVLIIILDIIISLTVIVSFRKTAKQVEKENVKDNTEEIVKVVKEVTTKKAMELKDNATDRINEAKNDLGQIHKKLTLNIKLVSRNAKFSGQKIYNQLKESEKKFKDTISKIKMKSDITESVKERFLEKKSWLTKRLTKAFPDLKVKTKENK